MTRIPEMEMEITSRTRGLWEKESGANHFIYTRPDYARRPSRGQQEKSGREGSRYADALWWMEPATVIPIESVSLFLFLSCSFARARVTLTHFVHVKAESSSRCLSLRRLVYSSSLNPYVSITVVTRDARPPAVRWNVR